MYLAKDVSIIIPTYNRAIQLEKNLRCLSGLKSKPKEILIIDQTKDSSTKKVFLKFRKKLTMMRYFYSKIPSIAIAKNVGVKKASEKSKILLFLDDDAYVGRAFLNEIIAGYNRHPKAAGIFGAHPISVNMNSLDFKIKNLFKKIFLLGCQKNGPLTLNAPYGNNGWIKIVRDTYAEWFSGTDPSFKKEYLKEIKFDENFRGWSLGEDVDISYRISKKYGSLYVVPASIEHKHPTAPYNLEKTINKIYMNQINHFYLYYKDFRHMKIQFVWNLTGIFIYRFLTLANITNFRNNRAEFKHFIKSFIYCLRNKKKIIKGDLSIPSFSP